MGYTNTDFTVSKMDKKSTSRSFTFVGGNMVTWRSKKSNVALLSNAKAEYCAHHGIKELSWLKVLLSEIGFGPKKS